jgi:hypothetical protein
MCSYWVIKLAEDMNGDGRFTVSDVGLWIEYFFFLPGDFLVGQMVIKVPRFSQFFEINDTWCHGFLSGLFGLFFLGYRFFIVLGLLGMILEALDKWAPVKDKPQ